MKKSRARPEGAVKKHGGVVNNYMGDGLLACFSGEDPADTVYRTARAGLDMLHELEDVNAYLSGLYGHAIDIGIGVHYGVAVVGSIGGSFRVMTPIGDSVNLASRIESANKSLGTRFLISEEAYLHAADQLETEAGTIPPPVGAGKQAREAGDHHAAPTAT